MTTNFDSKIGIFQLTARDGVHHLDFHSYSENNLWFHYFDQVTDAEYRSIGVQAKAVVKMLSNGVNYELCHNRLGHPGDPVMQHIHKHVVGVPKLKHNKLYSYVAYMSSKSRKII